VTVKTFLVHQIFSDTLTPDVPEPKSWLIADLQRGRPRLSPEGRGTPCNRKNLGSWSILAKRYPGRIIMPTFMMSLNWTDQGIRAVKDSPKRSEAARELAKKVGVEIKHLYLTSGDSDLVIFVEAPSGDNVAKFALAVSSLGNVRTRTVRAWSADEYRKLISELP
jgi:uncharacterized protein with GYD domain